MNYSSIFKVTVLLSLVFASTALVGCSKERVVSDDPEVIEKQRKAHVEMTKRELQER